MFHERKQQHIEHGYRIEDERPIPVNGMCSFVAVRDVPVHDALSELALPLEQRAEIAFKAAVAKALDEHARLGVPVYIWRNNRVVKLSPKLLLASAESRRPK